LVLPSKKIKEREGNIKSISILIAAYNEEEYIGECVQSIIESDLDGIDFEILVGSDGSSDATLEVLSKIDDERLRVFDYERGGKNQTINKLVDEAKYEALLFLDADFRLKSDNIRRVLDRYNQLDVGVIICPIEVRSKDGQSSSKNESIYQKYESFIRRKESQIGNCVNTLGSYIISKELFTKIPSDKYCDDLFSILTSISKGKRVYFDETNSLYEVRESNFFEEYARRKRLVGGGLATIFHFKQLLSLSGGMNAFFLWSHKILRWYSAFFLLAAYILSIIIVHTYLGLFTSYIITILLILSAMGYLFEKNEVHNPIKLPLFFVSMNIGFIKGILHYFKGKQNAIWSRKGLS
jgi:glycosyltransferase involved in cell wall biosynthesis